MNKLTPYQKEALNYKKHIALTANAGSGKTFVLAKRYIEIALQNDVQISSIVAITFTEKAASELYKKISDELDERLLSETNASIRKKLVAVRRHLVSAKISTIHSFCAELLKEYSPEAGIDANFKTIDAIESTELITESISNFVGNIGGDNDLTDDFKYLVRIFGSINSLSSQLNQMFSNRKTVNTLKEKLYSGNIEEISIHFREEFEKLYEKVIISGIAQFTGNVETINSEVLNDIPNSEYAVVIRDTLKGLASNSNIDSCFRRITTIKENLFTNSKGIRIRGYLNKEKHDIYQKEINYAADFYSKHDLFNYDLNSDVMHNNLAGFGKVLINVFDRVLTSYEESKRVKGLIDFDDLQLNVLKILDYPGVRDNLEQKYKYIMIDEYQDTNEIQYNIFLPILNHLKTGNLFIVGDEKQSIYMFRGAEPEIFQMTRKQINNSETGGKLLDLPHSFRVSPKIAMFTNILFSRLFEQADEHFNDVKYNELLSVRDELDCGRIEFLLKYSTEEGDSEAELVAKRILSLVNEAENGSIKFNDIALLTRKRNSFVNLEKAFNKYKIPFSLIGGKGFFQKQTINDIYNYLSFLLNSNDDLALIGILRSPFFSLPDDEIYSISLQEGNCLYEKLITAGSTDPELNGIINVLETHAQLSQSVALSTLLRTILTDTSYWAVAASKSNADQEIANLEKLISISNSFIERGFKSLYDFVSLLADSIQNMEDEGQANLFTEGDSVKIMTIHKSKGLEFPVVFLYGCNDYGQLDQVKSRNLSIDKQYGLLTKLPLDNDFFSDYTDAPVNGAFNYKAIQKAKGELKRLLYVAVTRAKDYLFISASHKPDKSQRGSFLELLIDGLQFDLNDTEINISGDQKFIINTENGYRRDTKKIEYKIKIVREIIDVSSNTGSQKKVTGKNKFFFYDKIKSSIKNEIISATKIAIFSQCPMKYHLTYNLGFTPLVNTVNLKKNLINFNHNEDEELNKHSNVRGLILHKLLELDVKPNEAAAWIEKNITQFVNISISPADQKTLKKSVAELYENYCSSEVKREFDSFNNHKNEFEIYVKENDYYLYGIIDKLIITGEKIILIDFKTDHIINQNINEKIQQYKNQIHFYGYIASKFFEEPASIELKIIFLEDLKNIFINHFGEEDKKEMSNQIKSAINKIRNYDFGKNLNHCQNCHFDFNKSCVSSI